MLATWVSTSTIPFHSIPTIISYSSPVIRDTRSLRAAYRIVLVFDILLFYTLLQPNVNICNTANCFNRSLHNIDNRTWLVQLDVVDKQTPLPVSIALQCSCRVEFILLEPSPPPVLSQLHQHQSIGGIEPFGGLIHLHKMYFNLKCMFGPIWCLSATAIAVQPRCTLAEIQVFIVGSCLWFCAG